VDSTQQCTLAQDQLDQQKQSLLNKRLEKAYRKGFAVTNPFPTFSCAAYQEQHDGAMQVNKRPRLTLYGEINEQDLFVSV